MRDSCWLVIAIGLIVLAVGFFAFSTLPFASIASAAIGCSLLLLDRAFLTGGIVKMRVDRIGVDRKAGRFSRLGQKGAAYGICVHV